MGWVVRETMYLIWTAIYNLHKNVLGMFLCKLCRLKGAVRLEKGERQADCQQQSSAPGSENSESQRENEESTQRHGLKTNLKRSTRWDAGVRKVWGTRKSESGNEVAREMV